MIEVCRQAQTFSQNVTYIVFSTFIPPGALYILYVHNAFSRDRGATSGSVLLMSTNKSFWASTIVMI